MNSTCRKFDLPLFPTFSLQVVLHSCDEHGQGRVPRGQRSRGAERSLPVGRRAARPEQIPEPSNQSGDKHEAHVQTHGSLSGYRPAVPGAAEPVLDLLTSDLHPSEWKYKSSLSLAMCIFISTSSTSISQNLSGIWIHSKINFGLWTFLPSAPNLYKRYVWKI